VALGIVRLFSTVGLAKGLSNTRARVACTALQIRIARRTGTHEPAARRREEIRGGLGLPMQKADAVTILLGILDELAGPVSVLFQAGPECRHQS
jgi:hypothetical protein